MQSCDFYKTSDYVYSSLAPIYLILVMTDWRAAGITFEFFMLDTRIATYSPLI